MEKNIQACSQKTESCSLDDWPGLSGDPEIEIWDFLQFNLDLAINSLVIISEKCDLN